MKKLFVLLLPLLLIALNTIRLNAQCTPDLSCKDTLTPGQICPESLADGYVGQPYNQAVTIIPPSSAVIDDLTIIIYKIEIDTVTNLPPGITYQVNAKELFPGTAYCVLLSGTPLLAGQYNIGITVIPFINVLGSIVALPPVENDTSVKMTIFDPDQIRNQYDDGFTVLTTGTNYYGEIKLGFESTQHERIALKIFNYMGSLIYHESMISKPGENYFEFTGNNLLPGCYIYSISSRMSVYSGKVIKAM
jgi:hypothetical protein